MIYRAANNIISDTSCSYSNPTTSVSVPPPVSQVPLCTPLPPPLCFLNRHILKFNYSCLGSMLIVV